MATISVLHISFSYDGVRDLFSDLSCSISAGSHIAIIGDNGCGKTTLLKLLAGQLKPDAGRIVINGCCKLLSQFNINQNKSGGQSQMDAIAAVFNSNADILLLDEPTNNLDNNARREFYKKLHSYFGTVVIVSHDRQLLNSMDALMELHDGKLNVYGGNYDFYCQTRANQQRKLAQRYSDLQRDTARLNQTRIAAQSMCHKHESKQAKEKANKSNGSKLVANSLRGKSQETESKRRKLIQQKLAVNAAAMQELSTQMRGDRIKIPLICQDTVCGKDVVIINDMSFRYDGGEFVFKDFDLHIRSGERIHLMGANGSGKTTLLKLICGTLVPVSGTVRVMGRVAYLDQNMALLNRDKSIVENIADIANVKIHDAHIVAANFGFRGDMSRRLVKNLSGGELLKATLAAVIGSGNQPDLLILDEPTNNLDIKSTIVLEDALHTYRGALLVVSHDQSFVQNICIENIVKI